MRDLETILETLGDYAGRTKDVDVWTEYVRNALARTICKQYLDADEKLWCVTLDPALEELINGHVQRSEAGGTTSTMPPRTQQQVIERIAEKVNEVAALGKTAVVLCSPHIRSVVRRMIEGSLGSTAVLGPQRNRSRSERRSCRVGGREWVRCSLRHMSVRPRHGRRRGTQGCSSKRFWPRRWQRRFNR